MKSWIVIANTDDVGDVFCLDCECRTPTPAFADNAEYIAGMACDGCGAVFNIEEMEWEHIYGKSAVDELKEACNGE